MPKSSKLLLSFRFPQLIYLCISLPLTHHVPRMHHVASFQLYRHLLRDKLACWRLVQLFWLSVRYIAVFFTLDAGLLARIQYPEGPATGHFDTGFYWFPCVYKQMLRWFPTFQVATTCFSCSPPDLNLVVTNFIFCLHVK